MLFRNSKRYHQAVLVYYVKLILGCGVLYALTWPRWGRGGGGKLQLPPLIEPQTTLYISINRYLFAVTLKYKHKKYEDKKKKYKTAGRRRVDLPVVKFFLRYLF